MLCFHRLCIRGSCGISLERRAPFLRWSLLAHQHTLSQDTDLIFLFGDWLEVGTSRQQGGKGSLIGASCSLKRNTRKMGSLLSWLLLCMAVGLTLWLPSWDSEGSQNEGTASPWRTAECLIILGSSWPPYRPWSGPVSGFYQMIHFLIV